MVRQEIKAEQGARGLIASDLFPHLRQLIDNMSKYFY